jgi:hypothetical protein
MGYIMNSLLRSPKTHKKEFSLVEYIKRIPFIDEILQSKELGLIVFF